MGVSQLSKGGRLGPAVTLKKKAEFLPANPILVGTFLSAVARGSPLTLLQGARRNAGGPTAAAGVKAGLKFAQTHLGFQFGFEEAAEAGSLQAAQNPEGAKTKEEDDASTLMLRDIVILEAL